MEYTFNGATKALGINYERERFHQWCVENKVFDLSLSWMLDSWLNFWNEFLSRQDARDLADTQADALGVLF